MTTKYVYSDWNLEIFYEKVLFSDYYSRKLDTDKSDDEIIEEI